MGVGSLTVTITDASGTTTVRNVTLTSPSPLQVSTTTTTTCPGASTGTATVTANGGNNCQGYSYAWSIGGNTATISNLAVGGYTVTVTDIAGCTAVQTANVLASSVPNPSFTQSGNTLTSTQSWSSYQWLLNGSNIPGATASTYTLTQSGTYSLQVTDANGCTGVSSGSTIVGIDPALGGWEGMTLFPNPVTHKSGMIEVRLRTDAPISEGLTVRVQNVVGQVLFTTQLPELQRDLPLYLPSMAVGTYFVEVTAEGYASHGPMRKMFRMVVQ